MYLVVYSYTFCPTQETHLDHLLLLVARAIERLRSLSTRTMNQSYLLYHLLLLICYKTSGLELTRSYIRLWFTSMVYFFKLNIFHI